MGDFSFLPDYTLNGVNTPNALNPTGTITPTGDTYSPSGWDSFAGWTDKNTNMQHMGWGMPAIGGANALMQSWLGLQQLSMAKRAMSEQRRQFDLNWGAQRNSFNNQLEERYRMRSEAGDPNSQDMAGYMAKWGLK